MGLTACVCTNFDELLPVTHPMLLHALVQQLLRLPIDYPALMTAVADACRSSRTRMPGRTRCTKWSQVPTHPQQSLSLPPICPSACLLIQVHVQRQHLPKPSCFAPQTDASAHGVCPAGGAMTEHVNRGAGDGATSQTSGVRAGLRSSGLMDGQTTSGILPNEVWLYIISSMGP